jgi:hypothetical protein
MQNFTRLRDAEERVFLPFLFGVGLPEERNDKFGYTHTKALRKKMAVDPCS